jgi:hypothetical protein
MSWNDKSAIFYCARCACISLASSTRTSPPPGQTPASSQRQASITPNQTRRLCSGLRQDPVPPHLVERILADTYNGINSINHTRDSVQSQRRNPIGVPFETKTPNGSESEALTQLSLWAATPFDHLRTLLPRCKRDIVVMPLPLIMAAGGRYSLLFTIDGSAGQRIRVVGEETALGIVQAWRGVTRFLPG